MAFAALWERWEEPAGTAMETCTILTTVANTILLPVHDRMPVIVAPRNYGAWLDPSSRNPEALKSLLSPCDPEELDLYPVRTIVNDPSREGKECIQAAS
jgi:putative SOS response-associated peptidase YedK